MDDELKSCIANEILDLFFYNKKNKEVIFFSWLSFFHSESDGLIKNITLTINNILHSCFCFVLHTDYIGFFPSSNNEFNCFRILRSKFDSQLQAFLVKFSNIAGKTFFKTYQYRIIDNTELFDNFVGNEFIEEKINRYEIIEEYCKFILILVSQYSNIIIHRVKDIISAAVLNCITTIDFIPLEFHNTKTQYTDIKNKQLLLINNNNSKRNNDNNNNDWNEKTEKYLEEDIHKTNIKMKKLEKKYKDCLFLFNIIFKLR